MPSKTKISEIKRIENFLDVELNKEKVVNTLTNLYFGKSTRLNLYDQEEIPTVQNEQ
ncbi:hypothetical protein [Staphylococcus aureus]|uniref:hypothetical protein n=1 Tax=Staphylococcus aureus TaxID=1280 RepID=UPI000A649294|nr:hypothetical protein [Staphylococcus aureus]